MYVEISNRRSGKTTRLAQRIMDIITLNPHHTIYLHTISRRSYDNIINMLGVRYPHNNIVNITYYGLVNGWSNGRMRRPNRNDNSWYFFDEFSYMSNYILKQYLLYSNICDKCYFSGTPHLGGGDSTLETMRLFCYRNGFTIENHGWGVEDGYDMIKKTLRNHKFY